jgi:tetratricopeptide (TPR) repeat protein
VTGDWSSFIPGLIVLAIGLLAGFVLAARLRHGRKGAAPAMVRASTDGGDPRDLELEREDLEERRAQIYARLRDRDGEDLSEAERRDFEVQAARTLRRLEEIDARAGARRRDAPIEARPERAAAAPARGARAGMVGFAYGALFAALIAALFYWVARDATPRAPEPAAPPMAAAGDGDIHSRLDQLSPPARERVNALLARLDQQPDDLDARKALTEAFVKEGLFFEAFEQSERILAQSPNDVDGLYFQGLIRLTMGQDQAAIELLDRAIAAEPGFVSARLVRGLSKLRLDQRDAAIADWRAGLEAAGGRHEGLERLLQMAESGASAEEILGSPPHQDEPSAAGGDGAVAAGGGTGGGGAGGTTASGEVYRVRLELAPGRSVPPGATLFVNLRIVAGAGPPSAVKRIDAPSLPLEITLGANDAMPGLQGRPLPASGTVSARLDGDGNASTREPGYPSAQAEASLGAPVTLVLE